MIRNSWRPFLSISGNEVISLVYDHGRVEWDGRNSYGIQVPSGMYLAVLVDEASKPVNTPVKVVIRSN